MWVCVCEFKACGDTLLFHTLSVGVVVVVAPHMLRKPRSMAHKNTRTHGDVVCFRCVCVCTNIVRSEIDLTQCTR